MAAESSLVKNLGKTQNSAADETEDTNNPLAVELQPAGGKKVDQANPQAEAMEDGGGKLNTIRRTYPLVHNRSRHANFKPHTHTLKIRFSDSLFLTGKLEDHVY